MIVRQFQRGAFVASLLVFASGCLGQALPREDAVAGTDHGRVRGLQRDGYIEFLGIPYAAPPVGELRWEPPHPAQRWRGVREASEPGHACAQTQGVLAVPSQAEDCLYLNVATPAADDSQRPVMVWLHGGGFRSGAGSQYDPAPLMAEGDVVVVSVNYRLGIFGFFGLPGLEGSGSFGLLDQQAALEWVRRNIASFGGDPDNVTLFGESAGALSICALMTSPTTSQLFDKAIVQSGPCNVSWPRGVLHPLAPQYAAWAPATTVEARGRELAKTLGCVDSADSVACLRDRTVGELIDFNPQFAQPAFGTETLPQDPARVVRDGGLAAMPLLIGVTRHEHTAFIAGVLTQETITAERYRQLLELAFGGDAEAVLHRYPIDEYDTPANAWSAVGTDVGMACASYELATFASSRSPTYFYEFADPDAPNPGYPTHRSLDLGTTHASELAYLFDMPGAQERSSSQRVLSRRMIRYWTEFAATSRPDSAVQSTWPPFDPRTRRVMVLTSDERPGEFDFANTHHCDFWKRHRSGNGG